MRNAHSKKQGYDSFDDKLQKNHITNFANTIFDEQMLLKKIKTGESINDIANYFGLSPAAIYKKCIKHFGHSLAELRDKDFNFNGYVHTDGNYKDIDKDILLKLIKNNLNNKEICACLNISKYTLHNKCRELFGMSIQELRDETYSMHSKDVRDKMSKAKLGKTYAEIYGEDCAKYLVETRRNCIIGNKNPNYKDVDSETLYNMIQENISTDEIIAYFGISKPTLYSKIQQYFNTTLKEMRKNVRDTEKSCAY